MGTGVGGYAPSCDDAAWELCAFQERDGGKELVSPARLALGV